MQRMIVAVGLSAAISALVSLPSAGAESAQPPDEVGKKYSDARNTLSQAGFKVVVSSTIGGGLSQSDCIVVNEHAIPARKPAYEASELGPMPGFAQNRVLLSLDCTPTKAKSKAQ